MLSSRRLLDLAHIPFQVILSTPYPIPAAFSPPDPYVTVLSRTDADVLSSQCSIYMHAHDRLLFLYVVLTAHPLAI